MLNKILKYLILTSCAVLAAVAVARDSSSAAASDMMPESHEVAFMPLEHHYMNPEYRHLIDTTANVIVDSLGSLDSFMQKLLTLRSGAQETVSILHIGDSHIQAGFWPERLRNLFQQDFGDAGRGLIIPHKLAGTNEPRDYAIKVPDSIKYEAFTATNNQTRQPLGVTGTGVFLVGPQVEFEIWSKKPFSTVTLLHHPLAPAVNAPDSLDVGFNCTSDNTPTSTKLVLKQNIDTVRLTGSVNPLFNAPSYFGFSLENGNPGVLYHAVGSNGAAFQHIENNSTIIQGGASVLNPDLIIVSLGTNNCYGNHYRSDLLGKVIDRFVQSIRANYPGSAILLTTPRDSSGSRRQGYRPNPNIGDASRLIRESAVRHGVAFWDLYNAAGGRGTSEQWFKDGLAQRDRIHLTEKGYMLVGDMLYEALANRYNDLFRTNEMETDDHRSLSDGYTYSGRFSQYDELSAEEFVLTLTDLV